MEVTVKPRPVEIKETIEVTPPKLRQVYKVKPQNFSRGGKKRPILKPALKLRPAIYQAPLLLVTSFSPAGYKDYGERFLKSFVEHFPKDVLLAVFYEKERPQVDDPRIWYFDLEEDRDLSLWMARHGRDPRKNGRVEGARDFRFDAVRFAPKIFALTSPLLPTSGWRVWIDADVEAISKIPDNWFSKLLRTEAAALYIGRPKRVFQTSECGFVAYHTAKAEARQFLIDLRLNYIEGKIFDFPEWHDSAVFDVLRSAYEQAGVKFEDIAAPWYKTLKGPLSFEEHGHPWEHTRLGAHLRHYKGPAGKETTVAQLREAPESVDLRQVCSDPSIKTRYEQLTRLLHLLPHETIVEVGVAQGERAVEMVLPNLSVGKPVHYIGFDLFEDMTLEVSKEEFNGKKVDSLETVRNLLLKVQKKYPKFTFDLVKGNTRETMHRYKWPETVDLAFLDGGHSVETIESDFRALEKRASLIVLDDYYEEGVDTELFGCNKLIDALPKHKKILLPKVDQFGAVKIRMAATGEALHPAGSSPAIRIKTKNCVEDERIQANVRNSYQYIDRANWLPGILRPVTDRIIFVGGSPTTTDLGNPEYTKNWQEIAYKIAVLGYRLVVCKTSYQHAFNNDLVPWACILLDPRDHVAQWVSPVDKRVLFFVASMCDPSTWEHLDKPGVKIFGYHAGVGAGETNTIAELWKEAPIVHGGTTSIFRGIALMYNMGFRFLETIGIDSSYPTKPEKLHGRSAKMLQSVTIGESLGIPKSFWTDPELIAQSQDAEMVKKLHPGLPIKYLGDGLLQHAQKVLDAMVGKADPLSKAPREQMAATWLAAFKSGQLLAEAVYIQDFADMITERAKLLSNLLDAQPSFDEVNSRTRG